MNALKRIYQEQRGTKEWLNDLSDKEKSKLNQSKLVEMKIWQLLSAGQKAEKQLAYCIL